MAKKKGTNGVDVADAIIDRVESARPADPQRREHQHHAQLRADAEQKVNDLIFKAVHRTMFVFSWCGSRSARSSRPSSCCSSVPVVLLFTILCAMLLDFTIDRVSLFALIFSIGILVDDAIVVVENIYRRWLERADRWRPRSMWSQVGNPTILATLTVIGALLPMGAVTGMMGPYMPADPGAAGSVAMGISLFAAFVFTPWFRDPRHVPSDHAVPEARRSASTGGRVARRPVSPHPDADDTRPAKGAAVQAGDVGHAAADVLVFYFKWVAVKMLPLDNKPGVFGGARHAGRHALADTGNMAHVIAERLRRMPEVTAAQIYVGTARPFDFNGMVVTTTCVSRRGRPRCSCSCSTRPSANVRATRLRWMPAADKGAGGRYARTFSIVEMPPGPPVLQSVVAEVHGP